MILRGNAISYQRFCGGVHVLTLAPMAEDRNATDQAPHITCTGLGETHHKVSEAAPDGHIGAREGRQGS